MGLKKWCPARFGLSGELGVFFKKKAPALLLCIQKLDTQININYYKRQAHEKSLNNLSVFYYEDKTMRIQQTNQTVI
jgi:hypothetical protein